LTLAYVGKAKKLLAHRQERKMKIALFVAREKLPFVKFFGYFVTEM
jgi:hypothetical protein